MHLFAWEVGIDQRRRESHMILLEYGASNLPRCPLTRSWPNEDLGLLDEMTQDRDIDYEVGVCVVCFNHSLASSPERLRQVLSVIN